MKIGLSYDLKDSVCLGQGHPEDALEEYDSPETVNALAAAIEEQGYSTVRLGGGREFLASITQWDVDLVFNIAEGLGNHRGREAQVPAILEMLDIPFSGSDAQCLAICLDKPLTKKILAASGIITPQWHVISQMKQLDEINWNKFVLPAFIKPAYEGSSKGITTVSIVKSTEQVIDIVTRLLECYHQPVLVERFIAGDEITVGIIGNSPPKILGIMRVLSREHTPDFIYCLEVKRDWERLVDYECPARLERRILKKIEDVSLKIFQVLGCRDFARIDFKIDSNGEPNFLEINPLPGLNPRSGDFPIMAAKMGWTYQELILTIIKTALERYPQCVRQ
jgi:D-alanine-D-alanine ligase